ncbi:MAG: LysM peptidoglycan-binding domain-containing protein, partial [Chloroflexi bacterium]|nr:LysM peptidoglycan-binding domain-containing protein [Chloroflexota bacterium]
MLRRYWRLAASLLFCLLSYTLKSTSRPAAAAQLGPAYEILDLVNQVRARNGLPPFQINAALMAAAQNQANWMASNNLYSHVGEGGSNPQTRATAAGYSGYVSENIVGGTNLSPRQGVLWWENSPVHFNTMVSERYIEAGAGFATGFDQNFYALVVGRPAGSEPAVNVAAPQTEPLRITPIELAPPREDGSIVHVVQEGQALWTIAAYYDVDLEYLQLINNLSEDSFIQPGDEVIVRLADGQSPPPTPTPPLTHVVQTGENLWSIAARHHVEMATLLWYNNLTENAVLHPGDEIIIHLAPGQAPPP